MDSNDEIQKNEEMARKFFSENGLEECVVEFFNTTIVRTRVQEWFNALIKRENKLIDGVPYELREKALNMKKDLNMQSEGDFLAYIRDIFAFLLWDESEWLFCMAVTVESKELLTTRMRDAIDVNNAAMMKTFDNCCHDFVIGNLKELANILYRGYVPKSMQSIPYELRAMILKIAGGESFIPFTVMEDLDLDFSELHLE